MSVTLSEVKRAARAHRAPLAGESAGYLILAIADQVLGAPRVVEAAEVELTPDGALRVLSGLASSDTDAELSLRRALDQLLVVASSGSAALTRAGRRTSPLGLSALVRELEAALIPVNRGAARRALARVHRETLRALASGALPAEDQDRQAAPAVAAQGALPAEDRADLATAIGSSASTVEFERECEPEPPLEASDALTLALEVRTQNKPEPPLEIDVDMALEPDFVDSGEAPTVMVAHEVEPVADAAGEDTRQPLPPLELRSDACTRPEPVVLRRALRPTPLAEQLASFREDVPRTPALGSLAAELPQLSPEQIVQLSRDSSAAPAAAALPPPAESLEPAPGSAALDECTEQMPEVAPLSPAVALVASRHSDLSELLSSFQIGPGPGDSSRGLPRAIKEMADLDLTPAPFAALIR